jgi:cell division protein FtsN
MSAMERGTSFPAQKGSTVVGIIVGLVVGLGVALGVAFYISKAPVNFAHKNQNRTAEQDAQEVRKNKDWDPNASLQGKNPVKGPSAAQPAPEPVPAGVEVVRKAPAPAVAPEPTKDINPAPAKAIDPIGDLAKAKSSGSAKPDPFIYFVQAGAYRTSQDAEAQRAKLALVGHDAKVSEREQSGYTVYRVRIGPIDKREDADRLKERLETSGTDSVVVRLNR